MAEGKNNYDYVGFNAPPLLKKAIVAQVGADTQMSMGEYVRSAVREKLERDHDINTSKPEELRELIESLKEEKEEENNGSD